MIGLDIAKAIGLVSSAVGALAWYRSWTRSQYARERESERIFSNLKEQTIDHSEILKGLDAVEDRLSRLEILILKRHVA